MKLADGGCNRQFRRRKGNSSESSGCALMVECGSGCCGRSRRMQRRSRALGVQVAGEAILDLGMHGACELQLQAAMHSHDQASLCFNLFLGSAPHLFSLGRRGRA